MLIRSEAQATVNRQIEPCSSLSNAPARGPARTLTGHGAEAQCITSNPFILAFIRIKARQLCRGRNFSLSENDDIKQSMRLYLLTKASHFDPLRGNLEAFITQMLKVWVAMELRHRKRRKRCESFMAVSLESTPVRSDGGVTSLGAVLLEEDGRRLVQAHPLSAVEQLELREAAEHAIKHLQPEDRAMLVHVAEHGVASAARAFNVSRRQVLNARARARAHFEKAGFGTD